MVIGGGGQVLSMRKEKTERGRVKRVKGVRKDGKRKFGRQVTGHKKRLVTVYGAL